MTARCHREARRAVAIQHLTSRFMTRRSQMKLLLIHQNFPGQYKHLAALFGADPKVQIIGLGEHKNVAKRPMPAGVELVTYSPAREPTKGVHPYLRTTEGFVLRGQAVARTCMELRQKGFVPDLICVHAAWGEGLYLRDIFPKSRILAFFEFYYRSHGTDVGFDPEFPATLDDRLRIRTWNMNHQSTFFAVDWGISPTRWQAAAFPPEFHRRMSVIHDGIDTQALQPNPEARFPLRDGRSLSCEDEVITFVSRGLEPYRGFHVFMRALPELMKRRPRAQIVVVGGDTPSYGRRPKDAPNWREKLLTEIGEHIDIGRLHFVGKIPYPDFVNLLQVSKAHVYLTYPFVLSWSMLEAMSVSAPVVASSTPPVTEVIRHEKNGLLFDFFDGAAMVEAICRVLDDADLRQHLGQAGRKTIVKRYDLRTVCLPAQIGLMNDLLRGQWPKSAMQPNARRRAGH